MQKNTRQSAGQRSVALQDASKPCSSQLRIQPCSEGCSTHSHTTPTSAAHLSHFPACCGAQLAQSVRQYPGLLQAQMHRSRPALPPLPPGSRAHLVQPVGDADAGKLLSAHSMDARKVNVMLLKQLVVPLQAQRLQGGRNRCAGLLACACRQGWRAIAPESLPCIVQGAPVRGTGADAGRLRSLPQASQRFNRL